MAKPLSDDDLIIYVPHPLVYAEVHHFLLKVINFYKQNTKRTAEEKREEDGIIRDIQVWLGAYFRMNNRLKQNRAAKK